MINCIANSEQLATSAYLEMIKTDYMCYCNSKLIIQPNEEKMKFYFCIVSISSFISEIDEENLYRGFG